MPKNRNIMRVVPFSMYLPNKDVLILLYILTDDDDPGSLREGCRKKQPLWIVFEVSGTIHLASYLSSHKTIDGRGQRIQLTGKGLQLKDYQCSLRDYDDGLIDITGQSTDITISRCYFAQHDKTMLIGADPSHVGDRCIRVTIHHCFFDGTRQRQPRVRFGKAVDTEVARTGLIRSEGDMFLNGAQGNLLTGVAEECFFIQVNFTMSGHWNLPQTPSKLFSKFAQVGNLFPGHHKSVLLICKLCANFISPASPRM
ncbi:hypothetical protein RND71_008935 [Anisodus tanguticus]|uniref:Pectate lyase domain-containing protein n=1 Tax=Anisodus tanguticus TaxID=243964 RepID=A0AAE1SRW1_9SOLA|nr:hypothetical protein RND71_008935 [Anisodus tanguticus]